MVPTFSRITQKKGDRAVAQAVATFTKLGGDVLFPLTESAAYDLVVDFYGHLKRIQVRYSSVREVGLRRIHSNSKGYVVKRPREDAYDWLYVYKATGEEYLIVRKLTNQSAVTPQPSDTIVRVFKKIQEEWQSGLTQLT